MNLTNQEIEQLKKENLELKKKIFQLEEVDQANIAILNSLKTTEEELIRVKNQKEMFYSIIAHDLKLPLKGFVGLTEYAHKNLLLLENNDLVEVTAALLDSSRFLFDVMENLLDWSRLHDGKTTFDLHNMNLRNSVQKIVDSFEIVANKKKIYISNHIDSDIQILGDTQLINTIFRNLISNSIKFSNEDSKVEINSKEFSQDLICISVKDHGIGIDELILNLIFDKNSNYHTIGTGDERGTGLGLILCQEMLKMLGGKIWVESKVDEGSIFYITLPYAK